MRTFRSDNNAGLCPEALEALVDCNDGTHQIGYGDDAYSEQARAAFRRILGKDAAVFLVATGTAANTLAVACLTDPWQRVVCHRHSHWNDDESTAPERVTQCRTTAFDRDPVKLTVADIDWIAGNGRGDVHQPAPGCVTISNATEFGTVYTPAEVRELCDAAHAAGYRVHMDGARFANAVASTDADPRELTSGAGLDALSFGGTKNGLAFGEAVVFFPQGDGQGFRRAVDTFEFQRKSTGHLLSKHRFVAAPFARTLTDGSWLRHARHANAMARRLAEGLRDRGVPPLYPVEANGVFVKMPASLDAALSAAGHGFYPFGDAGDGIVRLMCSFDTTEDQVDALLGDVEEAMSATG